MSITTVTIPADHPALSGHFPGNPVVPGVVILDRVICAAASEGYRTTEVASVKFTAPMLPDMRCDLAFSEGRNGLQFTLHHGETLLASGTLRNGEGQ